MDEELTPEQEQEILNTKDNHEIAIKIHKIIMKEETDGT